MRRLLALLGLGLGLAPGAAPAGAQDEPYPAPRPHTTFALRDDDGVAVRRLDARVVYAGRRLNVRVALRATSRSGLERSVVLRVGRCIGGPVASPVCPPAFSRRIVLRRGATTFRYHVATVRIPERRVDSLRVSVTRPGRVVDPRGTRGYAELLLRGAAWRGPVAGEAFGFSARAGAGVDVRRVRLDAVGISPERARPLLGWTMDFAESLRVRTVAQACAEGCPARAQERLVPAGSSDFRDRPTLRRAGDVIRFGALAADAARPLFAVALPWPEL